MKIQILGSVALLSAMAVAHADTTQFRESEIFKEITSHRSSDFSQLDENVKRDVVDESLALVGQVKSDLQTASKVPLSDGHSIGFRLAEGTVGGVVTVSSVAIASRAKSFRENK